MAGLDEFGFTPKTQDEIRQEIGARLREHFGNDINLEVGSRFGTLADIFSSELASAWEALQADYNSRFRNQASFNNLDQVGALTNCERKGAVNASAAVYFGSEQASTPIPAGTLVAIPGVTGQEFALDSDAITSSDCFIVVCDQVPTSGNLVLKYNDVTIATIESTALVTDMENSISTGLGIPVEEVRVTGTLSSQGGIHITLLNNITDIIIEIDEEATELFRFDVPLTPKIGFATESTESVTGTGQSSNPVSQGAINEFVTPVASVAIVKNFAAGLAGRPRETDAAYRFRMKQELQAQGTATIRGFAEELSAIDGVQSVNIVENDQDVPVEGRPPHSFECYIEGGSDDEVAQTIYDKKPLGIRNVTTLPDSQGFEKRTGTIVTVNGDVQELEFSSPIRTTIYIKVSITTDAAFATNGQQQLKEAILAYMDLQDIGSTLYTHKLYTPVTTVPGVVTAEITTGRSEGTYSPDNITAVSYEYLVADENSIAIEEA